MSASSPRVTREQVTSAIDALIDIFQSGEASGRVIDIIDCAMWLAHYGVQMISIHEEPNPVFRGFDNNAKLQQLCNVIAQESGGQVPMTGVIGDQLFRMALEMIFNYLSSHDYISSELRAVIDYLISQLFKWN